MNNEMLENIFENQLLRGEIDEDFLDQADERFYHEPINIMARNAVATVGALNASLDTTQANQVSHIFLNSTKPDHLRATNQESSGRCWMFAGLNVFRYLLIKALNLENFEFSETYLFFYDKLERANFIIQYYIDHPEANPEDRMVSILLSEYYGDGGYWNYFANLVNKYGLVPKEAMEETFHSGWTTDMNDLLRERILSCCNQISRINQQRNPNQERIQELREHTMEQIYGALVKFLGHPPQQFSWSFRDIEHNPQCIQELTPHSFSQMVLTHININDFVTLANIPGKEYYQTYRIRNCNNMIGGEECLVLNLPIEELKKYASKTIIKGMPVWFAGDVSKGYGYHKSVLDEKIFNTDLLFGEPYKWNKAEKLKLRYTEGNHAMTLTGVNFDYRGKPYSWQVENSWGYYDHELPGLDGFLAMSDQWFDDNLVQIVVHRNFLSRNILKALSKDPIVLEPWDYMAPALKIRSMTKPEWYNNLKRK